MVGIFDADGDATPLTPAERDGLRPQHITTRGELNELEAANILEAITWAFERKRNSTDERFLLSLHKRMLGKVWKWAGEYRKTERNLGSASLQVPVDMRAFLDTVKYWLENSTFAPDEIAIRFHHGLVKIHPFANGNGRWSRLAADILITQLGGERFTWRGGADLQKPGEDRTRYIAALKTADDHDFNELIEFARA